MGVFFVFLYLNLFSADEHVSYGKALKKYDHSSSSSSFYIGCFFGLFVVVVVCLVVCLVGWFGLVFVLWLLLLLLLLFFFFFSVLHLLVLNSGRSLLTRKYLESFCIIWKRNTKQKKIKKTEYRGNYSVHLGEGLYVPTAPEVPEMSKLNNFVVFSTPETTL